MADDRCCCGCMHVRTGTFLIAIFEFAAALLGVASGIIVLSDNWDTTDKGLKYGGAVVVGLTLVWMFIILLLMVAIIKLSAGLILPHLVLTAVYMAMQTVATVLLIIDQGIQYAFIVLIWLLICYLWFVEYRCYTWIKGLES